MTLTPLAASAELAPLPASATVDQVLDALDARGDALESLVATVSKGEADAALGEDFQTRTGRLVYQRRPDGAVRIRASFDRLQSGEKVRTERIEYTLLDGVLTDRTYRSKVEVRRVVQRPGERLDLFRLGQGPFPLPIGQDRESVHREFEVTRIDPAAGDPPGTIHVRLVPRPETELSRKFKSIDVWVDPANHMPRRIETLDIRETLLTRTEFSDVKINAPLTDQDFTLEKIDEREWQITEEALRE